MKNSATADWRLQGCFDNLKGKEFTKKKFSSTLKNDHEHCEFCMIKITDLDLSEEHLSEGFVTECNGREHWICEKCFNDFKNKFFFKEIQ